MAWSLEQNGKLAEAVATLEEIVAISRGATLPCAAGTERTGWPASGPRRIAILSELRPCPAWYVSPFDIAVIHVGLGDATSVFHWLEEAFRQRVWRIVELTLPMFDSLRADDRWRDLVCPSAFRIDSQVP